MLKKVFLVCKKTLIFTQYRSLKYYNALAISRNHYPFGSPMPGRQYLSSSTYRYGFNGKENDKETVGTSNGTQDYGARIYNPTLGKFLSVDPITKKYAELTPYQFASNRPIDGIDIDGLEYATFTIFVYNGKVAAIKVSTDYELKAKNTQGPGIQYHYKTIDNDGNTIQTKSNFVENNVYGIYAGSKNPQLPEIGERPDKLKDYYGLTPIDGVDKAAMNHDLRYDKYKLKAVKGILDPASTKANEMAIADSKMIIAKKLFGGKDIVSRKKVTFNEAGGALVLYLGFHLAEDVVKPAASIIKGGTYGPTLEKPKQEIAPALTTNGRR